MPTLKIGPYKIPLKFIPNVTDGQRPAFGTYSDDPQLIEIDRSIKDRPEQLLAIVIHECLEAINCIHVVNLNHDQIEQLSSALTQLLQDNKYLRSLLP